MATKAQEPVPNLVKEGKLDEIFDRSAREKEHRDFIAGAKANPGVAKSVEEIERLHVEAETPAKEAANEAVQGLSAPVQKRPKTTMPGKRADAQGGAHLEGDAGDETVIDSSPPRTAEQEAWARHYMIRGGAIGLAIVLLSAFGVAYWLRTTNEGATPSAKPTGAAATGAPTAASTSAPPPTAQATATALTAPEPTQTPATATASAALTTTTALAKKTSDPTSPVKASVEPPPPVTTIPPIVSTPTTAVPPPPSSSGKKPIFP